MLLVVQIVWMNYFDYFYQNLPGSPAYRSLFISLKNQYLLLATLFSYPLLRQKKNTNIFNKNIEAEVCEI